jgi:hypothetical protein
VAANFDDLPVFDAHELADSLIQTASGVLGGGVHDRDDGAIPDSQVDQHRAEGAATEGALPGQEVVPNRRPAAMGASKGARPRQMPDGILIEARFDASEIPGVHSLVQSADYSDIFFSWHRTPFRQCAAGGIYRQSSMM